MIQMNAAIFLTLTRILIIPLLVAVFYFPVWLDSVEWVQWSTRICAGLFILAALTDLLDGYVARRFEQVTRLGALIDPIADKMIVAVALLLIVERFESWMVSLPALVIIARELAVSGLREWMAMQKMSEIVAVGWFGKIKTILQLSAIVFLLWGLPITSAPVVMHWSAVVGLWMLYIATIMTIYSMVHYLIKAKQSLKQGGYKA